MKTIKLFLIIIFSMGAFAYSAPPVYMPKKINYQGKIEIDGEAYTGTKSFNFKIFDALIDGTEKWDSGPVSLDVSKGVFSATLTGGTPTLSTGTFTGERWLEIAVGGVTLTPREEIVPPPFAMVAAGVTPDVILPAGQLTGALPAIDGSALFGIGGSDNLGNHVATTTLEMGVYGINTSSNITVAGDVTAAFFYGNGSNLSGVKTSSVSLAGFYDDNAVRSNLGLTIGSDVQAHSSNLATLAGNDGSNLSGVKTSSVALAGFYDDNAVRSQLGLTIGIDVQAHSSNLDTLAGNDGSGLINLNVEEDSLGNHIATTTLQMGVYGINTSSYVSAGAYQINGSTVVAILTGTDSLGVGVNAGRLNTGEGNSFFGGRAGYSNTTGIYNSFFGSEAGYNNTTGGGNLFFGSASGYSNTTGNNNSFFGRSAGLANTTGEFNVFIGVNAGRYTETGSHNSILGNDAGGFGSGAVNSFSSSTIMGSLAGYNLSTGSDNLLLGFKSGDSLTTGSGNIIIGYDIDATAVDATNELNIGGAITGDLSTGDVTITGNANADSYQIGGSKVIAILPGTASLGIGIGTGLSNTGNNNTFIGSYAGNRTTSGKENSFVGYWAGYYNTIGDQNSFFGRSAGKSNISGDGNSFFGYAAGTVNTTGRDNTFIGLNAGGGNKTGNNNNFIGTGAGRYNISGEYNAVIGNAASLYNETGSANAVVGYSAGFGLSAAQSFSSSTLMGYKAGRYLSTGSDNILIGFQAGDNLRTGNGNIIIGYDINTTAIDTSNELNIGGAITGDLSTGDVTITGNANADSYQIGGSKVVKLLSSGIALGVSAGNVTTGAGNSFVGYEAGKSNTDGTNNTVVGYWAGRNGNSTGNSFFGYSAGAQTTGNYNVFLGYNAGAGNSTGAGNVFVGQNAAGVNQSGGINTAVGYHAGYNNKTGSSNVTLGSKAGWGTAGISYSSSTILGTEAGYALSTGSDNILLGYKAGDNLETGSSNIIIGYDLDATDVDTTNELNIGGLIVGDMSTSSVTVLGELHANEFHGALAANVQSVNLGGVTTFDADGSGIVQLWIMTAGNNIATIGGCNSGVVKQGQKITFTYYGSDGGGAVSFVDTAIGSVAADNMVLSGTSNNHLTDGANRGSTITLMCTTFSGGSTPKAWVEISRSLNTD